ncbi:MAG: hypothetical protein HQL23_00280 [Candidatus Omnitrophica bacterium]|nr:hypothetical protein [Candidatus Omnitrophota bacterium]
MKICVIYASAGAGHMKAAEAVYESLKTNPAHQVVFIDALSQTTSFFKRLYCGGYFLIISRFPWLWRLVFEFLDQPFLQPLFRPLRRFYNAVNMAGLHRYFIREKFDYIISTHFMPNEIVSALKRSGKISSRLLAIVTDYDVHHIWLGSGVDSYAVATEWTKDKLACMGVEAAKIHVTGIPINEKFTQRPDIIELKERLGLPQDQFTVLIATGSFGIGPIEQLISKLNDLQLVVVCGHGKALYSRLSTLNIPSVKVMGLVNNMHELMAVSDVMVTKPGGLSIAEALASQLPMIFFSAIPGQETNNIKVLKGYEIGISDCSLDQIAAELLRLKNSRDIFLTAIKRTQKIARPYAVRDVLNLIR